VRAAEALLRTLGGDEVVFRVPASTANSGDSAQLGLAGAATEDVAIGPVVVQNSRSSPNQAGELELLISAASLAKSREITKTSDALTFFESALGVVVREQLMRVVSVKAEQLGGVAYLYSVKVSS
jgi:hypothetical protein